MNEKDKLIVIQKIPYFAELSQENSALIELVNASLLKHYDKGQIIFLEDQECLGLYYLHVGKVRTYKTNPDDSQQTLQIIDPFSFFNEVPAFDGGVNHTSTIALDSCAILIVPFLAIQRLLDQEPDVARLIIQNLASKLRRLTTLMGDLSLKQITSLVSRIMLNETVKDTSSLTEQVINEITQQQAAIMVGKINEMFTTVLETLQKTRGLEIRDGRIFVNDPKVLDYFSNLYLD